MGRLRDKVILITGAAGGIGSAVAEAVVRKGGIAIASDLGSRPGIDHPLHLVADVCALLVYAQQVGAHVQIGRMHRDVLRRKPLFDHALHLVIGDRREGGVVAVKK